MSPTTQEAELTGLVVRKLAAPFSICDAAPSRTRSRIGESMLLRSLQHVYAGPVVPFPVYEEVTCTPHTGLDLR